MKSKIYYLIAMFTCSWMGDLSEAQEVPFVLHPLQRVAYENMAIGGTGALSHCDRCHGRCYQLFEKNGSCHSPVCEKCVGHHGFISRVRQRHQLHFQSEFSPPCPGYFVHQFTEAQKINGALEQYVFYGFNFTHPQDLMQIGLTSSGVNKAHDIHRLWQLIPSTILVQPSGDINVDYARVRVVRDALQSLGLPVSDELIVIAQPRSPSISGNEAPLIYYQRQSGSPLNPVFGSPMGTTGTGFSNQAGTMPR